MQYRADISGLRALAVVPVVLYHAHAALVPGGFVGVDVFFVISGYLITSIIAADLDRDRFSFITFYDRRVRRIVPAYALVALVTTLAAVATLPPAMLVAFGQSLEYASVFMANRYFVAVSGYFTPGAEEQFFLHMWSLAVEEQFYLFFPLALIVLSHPRLKRFRGLFIWGILLASLYQATKNTFVRPNSAFFNFTSRAWELLLGSVLALRLVPPLRGRLVPEVMAGVGLAMIVAAMALFDHNTLFPGLSALLPTGGALLVIWAGEHGRTTRIGRLLALRPIAGVGLISYSLYLWHWPIFGFFKFHTGNDPGLVSGVLLVGAAVGVSFLSWRYVESRFRRRGPAGRRSQWASIGAGLLALACLAGAGFGLAASGGLPGRASPAFLKAQAALDDMWRGTRTCLQGAGLAPPGVQCRFGDLAPDAPLIALWGDSFANHHAPALDAIARDSGYGLLQVTKASAFQRGEGGNRFAAREVADRAAFRTQSMAALVADPRVRVVVIAGNWANDETLPASIASVKDAVLQLTTAGKRVILVGPPAGFAREAGARCVIRKRFLGLDEGSCNAESVQVAEAAAPVEAGLRGIAEETKGVELVLPRPAFCDASVCRPTLPNGDLGYVDTGHLNVAGSIHLLPMLRAAVERAVQTETKPQP
ncbi:MAG TPA: acyltransferase family protein [Xanthobacteraceae bacterium]|nr:acyltransferase family protein [Xanthobacteraceae bacterium]HQS49193.1 acyltransferase family protein [Xanthobacteraceae bacterium]